MISNGDFDEYWRFHLAREHQRLYPGTTQDQYALGPDRPLTRNEPHPDDGAVVFALMSWLIAVGVVIILGAVAGIVWREQHLPSARCRSRCARSAAAVVWSSAITRTLRGVLGGQTTRRPSYRCSRRPITATLPSRSTSHQRSPAASPRRRPRSAIRW